VRRKSPRFASPRLIASRLDAEIALPAGEDERFNGYGVIGLPFASGHLLALRRFAATSIGPGYTSLWHRTAQGRWIFYADVEPHLACTRYFGRAVDEVVVTDMRLEWTGPQALLVSVPQARLEWSVELASTPATRALNLAWEWLPGGLWRSRLMLSLIGRIAGRMLDVGSVGLHGQAPNGQSFIANPRVLWAVSSSSAVYAGQDLGPPGPLGQQVRLGDFWIPNRGIFAFGQAYFEPFDESKHARAVSRERQPAALESRSG
jgi:hypothetical protein